MAERQPSGRPAAVSVVVAPGEHRRTIESVPPASALVGQRAFTNLRLSTFGASLALLAACRDVPRYRPLDGITRVDVRVRVGDRDTTVASIADPDSLGRIVAFVNARRDGWERPRGGIPVPTTAAHFYRGSEFMGSVGSGPSFLVQLNFGVRLPQAFAHP